MQSGAPGFPPYVGGNQYLSTPSLSVDSTSKLDLANKLVRDLGDKLLLPVDHVVVSEIAPGAANETVETIPAGKIGVDIGSKTIERYAQVISVAKTVIWNGPMGVFEKPPFDKGTVALARAVADSGATSIVGGGDSEKAIKAAGVSGKITHVSTGGGASLEFLAGMELPGVAALSEPASLYCRPLPWGSKTGCSRS